MSNVPSVTVKFQEYRFIYDDEKYTNSLDLKVVPKMFSSEM